MLIEYKVRPITRFVVTRYETSGPDEHGRGTGGSDTKGEYDNHIIAHEVAYALCKAEHQRLGWPIDDDRIQYPQVLDPNGNAVKATLQTPSICG